MKKIFTIVSCLLVGVSILKAQTIERQVISSSGTTITDGTTTLNFTVGEIAVTTISDGTTTLSQGFHQPTVELSIIIDPIVFLQGAALNPNTGEESLMRDDLRTNDYIPTTSPYSDGLTCEATVLDVAGNDAIVDWVWIELRDATDNTLVKASRSALLQRDGNIVEVDGISNIEFEVAAADYYIAIQHRNHLGIISSSTFSLSKNVTIVDFTDSGNQITFGTNAQTTFGMPTTIVAMWTGNVNDDTIVQYSGTDPDTPTILSEVLNATGNFLNFPTFAVVGYNVNDINMDGSTQYSGVSPDVPVILQNVLAHPGNFLNFSTYQIIEQLPEN